MANHRRGLFLDLDGTLADSLSAMRQAYHLFLAKRGAHGSSAEFDSLNGPPLHEVVASLQQTHGLTGTLDDLTAAYLNTVAQFHQATRPTEGAEQVLTKALSLGWRVAVVTSNKRAIACDWLARTGLDRAVSLVVAAEDSSQGKPHPEPYLTALAGLECEARASLAVEDSASGLQAALDAELPALGLAGGMVKDWPDGLTGRLARFADLGDWLNGFVGTDLDSIVIQMMEAPTERLPPGLENQIDRVWKQGLARGELLFNGPVLAVRDPRAQRPKAIASEYKILYAERHDPAVREAIGWAALAVSGAALCEGHLVFARRSRTVSQHPGQWELAPSGGIEPPNDLGRRQVEAATQLLQELEEELGVMPGQVGRMAPIISVLDETSLVLDIGVRIELSISQSTLLTLFQRRRSDEYDDLVFVGPDGLWDFLGSQSVVPVSQLLAAAVHPHFGLIGDSGG